MQLGVECGTWPRLRTLVAGSESSSPVESTPIVGVGYTYITTLALSDKNFFGKKYIYTNGCTLYPPRRSVFDYILKYKISGITTFTIVTPTAASKPISEAPTLSPDFKTMASCSMSHPWQTLISLKI